MLRGQSEPSEQRHRIALNADEFTQQMRDSAAGRDQRANEGIASKLGTAGAPILKRAIPALIAVVAVVAALVYIF